jgi:hypothetical protein
MNRKLSLFLLYCLLCILFQVAFTCGLQYQNKLNNERDIANIETRIALDLSRLKIANKKFRTAADPESIQLYLKKMNEALLQLGASVSISSLQDIPATDIALHRETELRTLKSPEQDVNFEIQLTSTPWLSTFSFFAPLFAFIVVGLRYFYPTLKVNPSRTMLTNTAEPEVQKLIINLKDKSIKFGSHGEAIFLSNKPFCFYAALVDYCIQTDMPNLKHNNDVPTDLLLIANKYLYRLIELGHTKRKRPDFGANLDKTLSEIRSALDDAFKHNTEVKDLFYPPKAQGEGSRSKMHNYALVNNHPELVEFIGK